ncbi:MAG TPA: WbqC family protein [Caulobacteraceae bacterium]|nr:WbqC family protein [Caulobacteraceae bacterium]
MTTVVISQPMYFPWPGFFELVACADVYVHLDDTQFSKGSFTNRVQIKQPGGQAWMTIALADKGSFKEIRRLEPADPDFRLRHRDLVRQALRGAPHLDLALDLFDTVMQRPAVVDLLIASIEQTAPRLAIPGPGQWVRTSDLDLAGRSSSRVLDIVKQLGGTRYVTAHGAAGYLDHEAFEAAGVSVDYIDYSLTPYPQLHGDFTPYVSVLDLIANVGEEAASCVRPRTRPWREFLAERARREAAG